MRYCFDTRTGLVCFDLDRCEGCETAACVEACLRHGPGILALEAGRPTLTVSVEEARRRDTECLACEIECFLRGQQAITIVLPVAGLEGFRNRHGHTVG